MMPKNTNLRDYYFPENLEGFAPWVAVHGLSAPYGKCQCGCGQDAPLADRNYKRRHQIKGEPVRYLPSHNHSALPLDLRFWDKVDKRGPDECWEWQGLRSPNGYGVFHADEMNIPAHRYSLTGQTHALPGGLEVCHKCDNPPCVNPNHLFAGTRQDNVRDMYAKGRGGHRGMKGEAHHQAKLDDALVRTIRARVNEGESTRQLAKELGVSQSTIQLAASGKTWTHVR